MINPLLGAIVAGILPALIWLSFWLREDRKNPEPKRVILKIFALGMLSVIVVIPLQKAVELAFPHFLLLNLVLWALLEEALKYTAAYLGGVRSLDDNEPIDPLIYMITAALGFVAVENTLFILGPMLGHDILASLVTANMRFVGASLLHVVASGIVGSYLAFSFYKNQKIKHHMVFRGIILATAFHSIFNLFIVGGGKNGLTLSFMWAWVGVIALLWIFERVKKIARN